MKTARPARANARPDEARGDALPAPLRRRTTGLAYRPSLRRRPTRAGAYEYDRVRARRHWAIVRAHVMDRGIQAVRRTMKENAVTYGRALGRPHLKHQFNDESSDSDADLPDLPGALKGDAARHRREGPPSCVRSVGGPPTWLPVFHPDGHFRIGWDCAQMVVIAYVSLIVPVRIGFDWAANGFWMWLETVFDMYFLLDICVNFSTAIPRMDTAAEDAADREAVAAGGAPKPRGTLVVDRAKIARAYAKGWLLIDILAGAPVDYVIQDLHGVLWCSYHIARPCNLDKGQSTGALKLVKILRVFRILKLFRLARLKRLFRKYQDFLMYWTYLIETGRLVFLLIMASHWMGCFFALVYPFDARMGRDVTLPEKYVAMLYWAMQTITTVGYGDMTVQTTGGLLVATVCMAIGGLIFGWLIQYVLSVLDPDSFQHKQAERLSRTMQYLTANHLPTGVAARVLRHVRQQNSRQCEDRRVLDDLPRQMRAEVLAFLYNDKLAAVPLFRGASPTFRDEVSMHLFPANFGAGECVYLAGDLTDEGTYVVAAGSIELLRGAARRAHRASMLSFAARRYGPVHHDEPAATRAERLVSYLEAGALFGEGAALGCSRRTEDAFSSSPTELLTISGAALAAALGVAPVIRWRIVNRHLARLVRFNLGRDKIVRALIDMDLEDLIDFARAKPVVHADWRERIEKMRARFEKVVSRKTSNNRESFDEASCENTPQSLRRPSLRPPETTAPEPARRSSLRPPDTTAPEAPRRPSLRPPDTSLPPDTARRPSLPSSKKSAPDAKRQPSLPGPEAPAKRSDPTPLRLAVRRSEALAEVLESSSQCESRDISRFRAGSAPYP